MNGKNKTPSAQQMLQEKVRDADLCTGCGACVNLCPYQASYKDKIVILNNCDLQGGRCYAFCPRTPTSLENLKENLFDPKDLTPEIGAIKSYYITRSTDENIRNLAQHGGTVTTLMKLALEQGIIDGAILAEGEGNLLAHGKIVTDPAEVPRLGKSKFIHSTIVAEFHKAAKTDLQKLGVVAVPCQALALAKMRMKPIPDNDANIDKLKLVIGLFCGWSLSWRDLFKLIEGKTEMDKLTGMDIPPSKYKILELYTDKGTIEVSIDEVAACVNNSCKSCFDMTAEFSDISVGSARLDEGWEVAKGWNQVIIRTDRGQELIDLAKSKGLLEFHEIPQGNLDKLKWASMNKKKMAVECLSKISGTCQDLIYLDCRDPVLCTLLPEDRA
jgi:coenzyme F420 hydrogenase subunit beta